MQNQQLYGNDVKFDSQLNYTNAIMVKIQEIQFSLRIGKDCSNELANLLFLLTEGIKNPIEPKLHEIATRYATKIEIIRKRTIFPETFKWSSQHREKYRGVLINREQNDAIREMIPVIVNQLDSMGLLLNREKQTQI